MVAMDLATRGEFLIPTVLTIAKQTVFFDSLFWSLILQAKQHFCY